MYLIHTPKYEQWKPTLDVLKCQKDAGLKINWNKGRVMTILGCQLDTPRKKKHLLRN